jgi:uncharacterized membrane protein YphA (DoxX/SURF4 family)
VSRAALWSGWILSILPAFALVMSASMKLAKVPAVVEGFKKFDYPAHIVVPLGIVELSCAILFLIPRTAVLGAILVTGYFGGAIATHVRVSEPQFVTPLILGILTWLGLFLRDRRVRALIPLRT